MLAVSGCAVPASAGVQIPTYSPRREALSYFPATAPMVLFVSTDPQDPGIRRLATSGALRPLQRLVERHDVFYRQLLGLLGNDAAIGIPHAGGPPLAVLSTPDAFALDTFARARVLSRRAQPAGTYRSTRLYVEDGWAFGVRDRVLLVGRTVPELLEALDTRVSDDAFDPAQMTAVLPRTQPPAPFVHGYVDLRTLLDRAAPAVRAIPASRALESAGFVVGASPTALRGLLEADTQGVGLSAIDLPLTRARGARAVLPPRERALAVPDLGRLAFASERALRAALPVSALKLDAVRERLRAVGVALTPELLAGPATIVAGPALRLQPLRVAAVDAALRRAARGLRWRRQGPLYVTRENVRIGMLGGVLVAGRVPAARLVALAAARPQRLRGPAVLALPRPTRAYPRAVELVLGGSLRRVAVRLFSPLPPRP